MGGKSGGGARTPYEAPNTLSSAQNLRIIDAVCEGVVSGFANGNDTPLKSVFFNDTPVQNADGSYNFHGVTAYFLRGEQEQAYVPGFDGSERTVAVSAPVKKDTPVVRGVSDGLVTRIRVTVGVERNVSVQDNGDTLPATTALTVELVGSNGRPETRVVQFSEKSSGAYYHDVVFETLPPVPFNIRVSRQTPDSTSDKLANKTFFASYVEVIDAKLCYPHTAVAALKIDSDQFGSQVPRRNYLMKGKMVKVPSNYNPETREYSGQTWDGSFKTAWTNNPAWVFYDLLTNPRYSTLARRLKVSDIDKWSLYQVARYCDELVPDGFGGREPRFVCNAYVTDARQAGELLTDLASVFTGLPVWDGNQVSVVLDSNSDPVAQYSNSNVVDGLFSYSGAALKSVHTAVHVQYLDKYDGYRAKTEYIADDEAIKRYGLNIKQVTAFGCDSRGQAARFGAWTLQTELRQQNTVTFTVGREGLRHLPYDIIQIMDNAYAGAELSGRVLAVAGRTVTLDREVQATAGMTLYIASENGVVSAKVEAVPAKNQVRLDKPLVGDAGAVWALAGSVKPRLYRAIGIKENTDDGTYTITALLHDPQKYGVVDGWANFDRERHTLHNVHPELINANLKTENGAVVISWDNLTADGTVLTYDIRLYKDGKVYRHIPDAETPEIKLEGLPNGNYKAEIRGKNARGVLSEPLVKAWSIDYNVTGLRCTPKTLAIAVDWVLPQTVVSELVSELWYSRSSDFQTASKLASLPYPQNSYQLTGVGVADTYYFWVRVVDAAGNTGEFTAAVRGQADKNPAPIVQQVQGAIGKSALSQSLIASLNSDMAGAAESAAAKAQNAAAVDASNKVAAETAARQRALQAETSARTVAIQAAANKAARDLTAKASEVGTRIGAVENVNATQAQQISTVTAAQADTAVGLETEKRARADGDKAEAAARATLAARVATAEGNITQEQNARIAAHRSQVEATEALKTRMGNAESSITALQQTSVTRVQAESIADAKISAKFRKLDTRNDNQPPTWYWANYPRQTVSEFKTLRAVGLANAGGFVVVDTVVPWTNGSGGAITQTAYLAAGTVMRRKSDVAYTYANATYTYTKDQWTAWAADETVAGAQAKADAVKRIADAANALATRTDADFSQFTRTYATEKGAQAERMETLSAKFDNLNVGGRNLILNSKRRLTVEAGGADGVETRKISFDIAPGLDYSTIDTLTLSVYVKHGAITRSGRRWHRLGLEICVEYEDGSLVYPAVWVFAPREGGVAKRLKNTWRSPKPIKRIRWIHIAAQNVGSTDEIVLENPKLEVGSIATDWTPAPEDVDAVNMATSAELTAFKEAQASKDAAQTAEINVAKSQAQGNAAEIQTLKTTKADTNQVVAVARTGLQSEWQAAAAAAQTAAVQAASVDAQAKADKAKNDAIAEATRLNAATNAKIDTLKETVAEQERAISRRIDTVTAEVGKLGNAGGNLNTDSEFINGFNDQFSKEGGIFSVVKIGGVNAGKADRSQKAGDGWFTLASVPANKGIYQFSIYMLNQTAQLVKMYPRYLNRRRKWVKVGTTRKLTNNTDIVPSVPSRDDPADLNGFTRVIWNVDLTASENLHFIEIALHFPAVPANQEGAAAYFAKPMICEIPHINMPPVPYAANTSSAYMAAKVEQSVSAVADVRGKLQSMYTLKTETVSGNRRVISGLALGADGQTGDSQVLVYANKFAIVDPASKSAQMPFVVVTENGRSKMALDGDMIASGSIHGEHIAAGSVLSSPEIVAANGRFHLRRDGSINMSDRDDNVGLKMTSSIIQVFDENGEWVIRMGKVI